LYRFHFIFDFNEVYVPGARLEFPDCNLAIVYQNQTEIELEIGDLVIWFRQPSEIVHLDFTRLYGINNVYMDRNYLGAIVMDISSLAMDDVTIKTVDIGALNVFTNKNSGIQLDHYPDYDESLSLLLNEPEYRPDEYFSIDTNVLAIDTSGIFLFPLAYSEYPLVVDRLFISITYTYLDIDYEFVIDDFIFYTTNSLEVVSNEEISRYSYSY
ncbi:MAG: hypothetical protein JXB20_05130, partial [Bacilli bacterium]|nr:hypothetical protein [Bacilli bacterium]